MHKDAPHVLSWHEGLCFSLGPKTYFFSEILDHLTPPRHGVNIGVNEASGPGEAYFPLMKTVLKRPMSARGQNTLNWWWSAEATAAELGCRGFAGQSLHRPLKLLV